MAKLPGTRYGRWTVLSGPYTTGRTVKYELLCDCGARKTVTFRNVETGGSTSCGCFRKEQLKRRVLTHGASGTKVYEAWKSMHRRCAHTKGRVFSLYREKGIAVCKRWEKFENFHVDMGDLPFPGATLERRDNNKGYSKGNCKWVHKSEQGRNTSRTVYVELAGRREKLVDLIESAGLDYKVVYQRIYVSGWPVEKALSTPVGVRA